MLLNTPPTIPAFTHSVIRRVRDMLSAVRLRLRDFLREEGAAEEKESNSSSRGCRSEADCLRRLFVFTAEWNYMMQCLSSVYMPAHPVYLTYKPLNGMRRASRRHIPRLFRAFTLPRRLALVGEADDVPDRAAAAHTGRAGSAGADAWRKALNARSRGHGAVLVRLQHAEAARLDLPLSACSPTESSGPSHSHAPALGPMVACLA